MSENCIDIQHDVWKRAKWYTSHIFYIFYGNMGNKSCCFSPRKFTRQARKTLRFISRISIYYRGRWNQGAGHLPSPRFWKYIPEVKHFSSKGLMCISLWHDLQILDPPTALQYTMERSQEPNFLSNIKKNWYKGSFSTNTSIQNIPLKIALQIRFEN